MRKDRDGITGRLAEDEVDFVLNVNRDTDPERLQDFGRRVAEALKSI